MDARDSQVYVSFRLALDNETWDCARSTRRVPIDGVTMDEAMEEFRFRLGDYSCPGTRLIPGCLSYHSFLSTLGLVLCISPNAVPLLLLKL